jgi:hypothetical protein
MKTPDLLDLLEFFIEQKLKLRISRGEEELFIISARDRNIDVEIKDEKAARGLLRELHRWRS